MRGKKTLSTVLSIAAILVVAAAAFAIVNRPQRMVLGAGVPADFPADDFSHERFETLLRRYTDRHGDVNYEEWSRTQSDRLALDQYLAAVAAYSPVSSPARFPRESDALAYWLNAYNAWVIWSVLDNWPLESVTDVRAPLEATTGFGFFWRQRFLFGGTWYSLYAVENDIIRGRYRDPRIHFVLNCASDSCPPARPELPDGDDLEAVLRSATEAFINDPKNVRVDHDARTVTMNIIFKWYRRDFLNDLRRRRLPAGHGLIDYLIAEAHGDLKASLERARGYRQAFSDYDWSINAQ